MSRYQKGKTNLDFTEARDSQWCSGKYLFGGTHGERGARAYNGGLAVWGQRPQRGPEAEPLVEGKGGEAPLKLKGFTFWTCNGNSKLALQLSVFWKLGKPLLFVISLQN